MENAIEKKTTVNNIMSIEELRYSEEQLNSSKDNFKAEYLRLLSEKSLKDKPRKEDKELPNKSWFHPYLSHKNLVFSLVLPWSQRERVRTFAFKVSNKFIIVQELGEHNKEHFHLWFESLKVKKETASDYSRTDFPELVRKGKGGANLKGALKYVKDPQYQFFYLFKEDGAKMSSLITGTLTDYQCTSYKEKYHRLREIKDLGTAGKFYNYIVSSLPEKSRGVPKLLIIAYIKYTKLEKQKTINPTDMQNKLYFVLARESPKMLEEMFNLKWEYIHREYYQQHLFLM